MSLIKLRMLSLTELHLARAGMRNGSLHFLQIVAGDQSSNRLFQDARVTAFHDIHPAAPAHILIIPNRHISSMNELGLEDEGLAGHMLLIAKYIAEQQGIAQTGYRLIINTGRNGGQVVEHLHLHLLGGQRMRNPIG